MKYFGMKCANCHKLIGEYAALELPTMIAYFLCTDCRELEKGFEKKEIEK